MGEGDSPAHLIHGVLFGAVWSSGGFVRHGRLGSRKLLHRLEVGFDVLAIGDGRRLAQELVELAVCDPRSRGFLVAGENLAERRARHAGRLLHLGHGHVVVDQVVGNEPAEIVERRPSALLPRIRCGCGCGCGHRNFPSMMIYVDLRT